MPRGVIRRLDALRHVPQAVNSYAMKPAGMIVVPLMIYSVMITPFRMKTDMEFLWDVNSEEVEF